MSVRIWVLPAILMSVICCLTACPERHGPASSSHGPVSKVFYVRGDPAAIIAGAQTNTVSPITDVGASEWNKFALISLTQFAEREPLIMTHDLEKENTPENKNESSETRDMSLKVFRDQAGQWKMITLGGDIVFAMDRGKDGRLQPTILTTASGHGPAKALHWSVSADGNYMSLLFSVRVPDYGNQLVALYFERMGPVKPIPTTNPQYIYLSGAGRKVGWGQGRDLEVHLCSASYRTETGSAVERWNKVLTQRLHMKWSQVNQYAPFSDLNEHCVYVIDAYLQDGRDDVFMYGSTAQVASLTRAEVIDSDIFIFRSEFQKMYKFLTANQVSGQKFNDVVSQKTEFTFLHEFGHFLGLDHKFDGTPSVMSYSFDIFEPTPYDIEAVQELYPIRR